MHYLHHPGFLPRAVGTPPPGVTQPTAHLYLTPAQILQPQPPKIAPSLGRDAQRHVPAQQYPQGIGVAQPLHCPAQALKPPRVGGQGVRPQHLVVAVPPHPQLGALRLLLNVLEAAPVVQVRRNHQLKAEAESQQMLLQAPSVGVVHVRQQAPITIPGRTGGNQQQVFRVPQKMLHRGARLPRQGLGTIVVAG